NKFKTFQNGKFFYLKITHIEYNFKHISHYS
ncbi:MAG: hypothetical protein ACI863_000738, partial [Flavobacteriales bacterium]